MNGRCADVHLACRVDRDCASVIGPMVRTFLLRLNLRRWPTCLNPSDVWFSWSTISVTISVIGPLPQHRRVNR
ncbi:hypothetical protein GALMADRAFT_237126 [Galerina marginata CBS 339.88]|uniref:Uncharacterized protein n=1 Tax=Galerina marginata (strain CBS 339.88) TaxID=685588 RepID=A0A067TWJ5_GALM3|nr:hypothetical protein GALMADRAFT_237126 [Galerina marginata CBS 339.88]